MGTAGILERRYRPWTRADESFLISAKRERFGHKDIAHVLRRTAHSVDMKVKRLEESGVLLRHREEELALLEKLMAESEGRQLHGASL